MLCQSSHFNLLSLWMVRSGRQCVQEKNPDIFYSRDTFQRGHIIYLVSQVTCYQWDIPGTLLKRDVLPEQPQLNPFNEEEQRIDSELLQDDRAAYFEILFFWSWSMSHEDRWVLECRQTSKLRVLPFNSALHHHNRGFSLSISHIEASHKLTQLIPTLSCYCQHYRPMPATCVTSVWLDDMNTSVAFLYEMLQLWLFWQGHITFFFHKQPQKHPKPNKYLYTNNPDWISRGVMSLFCKFDNTTRAICSVSCVTPKIGECKYKLVKNVDNGLSSLSEVVCMWRNARYYSKTKDCSAPYHR